MKKILLPIITALLFSGSYVAAKYATFELEPLTTTLLRYTTALLFLSALLFYFKIDSLKIEKKDIPQFLLLALFGVIGYHYFFFTSLKYTIVANTGIINGFSPVFTAFFAAIFLREKLTKKNYLGISLALMGILILITHGKVQTILSFNFNYGDLFMLLAVISWVVYSLLIKKLSKKYEIFTLTFYATFSGVIILFFLASFEQSFYHIMSISKTSFFAILYMGIGASGIGYLLYNLSIKDIGPTKTATLVNSAVPFFVAILSVLFFQESITFIMIISGILIVAGLYLALSHQKSYK